MILPHVECGHFALGTLSETCFQEQVFEVNVKTNITPIAKSRNVSFDTQIKVVSYAYMILYILINLNVLYYNFEEFCIHVYDN